MVLPSRYQVGRAALVLAVTGLLPRAGLTAPPEALTILLGDRVVVVLAAVEEGREVLGTLDEFVRATGTLERQVLARSPEPVSDLAYAAFAAKQVRAWEAEERDVLRQALGRLAPKLRGLERWLPPRILIVKTTGREGWGAAYTRGAAIVFPRELVAGRDLDRLLAHELFHVLTRHHPRLRKPLYEIVGFETGLAIELPPDLAERRITNPDAPLQDCAIRLPLGGEEATLTPVLFSRHRQHDPERPVSLGAYLEFKLLVIGEAGGWWKPRFREGKPWLLDPLLQPGLMERIGRNTAYIIHPEEILADNFVALLNRARDVPSPWVIEGLERVLAVPERRRARI